jgi:hypothetical protein
VKNGTTLPFDPCDRAVFDDCGAAFVCHPREADHQFSWIECASGNLFHHSQGSGIVPLNRRGFQSLAAANFKSAMQREIAIDVELGEDALEAAQNISEAGKIARGGFREGHPPGTAAGSRADALRLEYGDGFSRRETAQPGSRGQARETAADDREIDRRRDRFVANSEIDVPGRNAPVRARIRMRIKRPLRV